MRGWGRGRDRDRPRTSPSPRTRLARQLAGRWLRRGITQIREGSSRSAVMRSVRVRTFFFFARLSAGFSKLGGRDVCWRGSRRASVIGCWGNYFILFCIVLASLWLCLLRRPEQFFCAEMVNKTLTLRGGALWYACYYRLAVGLTSEDRMGLRQWYEMGWL